MKCDCLVKIVKGILSRLILACDTGPFVTGDPPAIVRLSVIVCALRTSSFVLISVLIITTLRRIKEKASRFSAGMNPTLPFTVHRSVAQLDIPRYSNPSLQVSLST